MFIYHFTEYYNLINYDGVNHVHVFECEKMFRLFLLKNSSQWFSKQLKAKFYLNVV